MKQVKLSKELLVLGIPVVAVAVAIICSLFLTGASYTEEVYGITASASVSLIGLIFGGSELKTEASGYEVTMDYSGGMSIFGLVAFLLAVAAIVVLVVAYVKKDGNKYDAKLIVLGLGLVALSGVLMLLLLTAGTEMEFEGMKQSFKEAFGDLDLGFGAILWTILCLAGAGTSFVFLLKDLKAPAEVEAPSAE